MLDLHKIDWKVISIAVVIGVLSIVTLKYLRVEGMIVVVFWFIIPVLIKQSIDFLKGKFAL
ncbi:MAG: hypothetical protein ACOC55_01435 [Candidatus Natronoplasma sp.]